MEKTLLAQIKPRSSLERPWERTLLPLDSSGRGSYALPHEHLSQTLARALFLFQLFSQSPCRTSKFLCFFQRSFWSDKVFCCRRIKIEGKIVQNEGSTIPKNNIETSSDESSLFTLKEPMECEKESAITWSPDFVGETEITFIVDGAYTIDDQLELNIDSNPCASFHQLWIT